VESNQSNASPVDRKFLHDISSPLTILKIVADRIREDMELEDSKHSKEQYLAWMQKICGAVDSLEKLLSKKKAELLKVTEG